MNDKVVSKMVKHLLMASMILGLTLLPGVFLAQEAQQTADKSKDNINLVIGLDGARYKTYLPSLVREVQQALHSKGLYNGEINGLLSVATMIPIGEYQRQNHLHVSGIPSPLTREHLLSSADQNPSSP